MLNTRDEILRAFAVNILDIIPKPPIPTFSQPDPAPENQEDQEKEMEIDPDRFQNTLRELERQKKEREQDVPIEPEDVAGPEDVPEDRPISIREDQEQKQEDSESFDEPEAEHPWSLQDAGTPEWSAEHYPEAYLRGHAPFTKYVGRSENDTITNSLMNKIVETMPEKYFEWRLDQNMKLEKWEEGAVKGLIDQDPERALIISLPKTLFAKRYDLLPLLWSKMVEQEGSDPKKYQGLVRKRMRDLALNIRSNNPKFFKQPRFGNLANELIEDQRNPLRYLSKPLSPRDDPAKGSFEWMAEKYPQIYLKGIDDKSFSRGHRRERGRKQEAITDRTVRRLIDTNAIKFFEWGLNRPTDLHKYIQLAAEKIVKDDPQAAIMADLFKMDVFHSFLPDLWDNLVDVSEQYGLPGYLGNRMVSFWKKIQVKHSQYYKENIMGTPLDEKLSHTADLISQKRWRGYGRY